MTAIRDRTYWRIRRLRWLKCIVGYSAFPVMFVVCTLSFHEPAMPYTKSVALVVFAAMSLLGFYALFRETCVGVGISREGIALKYLSRTDIVPMRSIQEIFYGSTPTLFRGENRVVSIDVQGRSAFLRLRENDFACDPGEIERAMMAYCPEQVTTKTLTLTDLIGRSDPREAVGSRRPEETVASLHRYHIRCKHSILAKTIALLVFAAFAVAFIWGPILVEGARWLGLGLSIVGVLWLALSICFRELLGVEISRDGVRLRYPLRSRFILRQAVSSVRVQVCTTRERPRWVHFWLRVRGGGCSIHLCDRDDGDVLKAIEDHYSSVADVIGVPNTPRETRLLRELMQESR